MYVYLLYLHVSLTADAAVNKESSVDERTPAAKAGTEAKGKDEETAEDELSSNSSVLGNIPEKLNQEFLEMLVENVLKDSDSPSTSQSFTLEVIPGINSAVVTFQSGKGTHSVCVCVCNIFCKCPNISSSPPLTRGLCKSFFRYLTVCTSQRFTLLTVCLLPQK